MEALRGQTQHCSYNTVFKEVSEDLSCCFSAQAVQFSGKVLKLQSRLNSSQNSMEQLQQKNTGELFTPKCL